MHRKSAETSPRHADRSIAVLTCAVLEMEVRDFVADLPSIGLLAVMPQGLHNEPDRLRIELQRAIMRIEQSCPHIQHIVLGYGVCSRGLEGIFAKRCNLILARAHDCITILLGSKEHYANYVALNPGTYWYSPGWNKHHTPPGPQRYEKLKADYAEKYGQDNADYLMASEQHWFSTYNRATYVHLTVGATEKNKQYTRHCAKWLHWQYDEVAGDPALLKALLTGQWDEERFLVIPPGDTLTLTSDDAIIRNTPAADSPFTQNLMQALHASPHEEPPIIDWQEITP